MIQPPKGFSRNEQLAALQIQNGLKKLIPCKSYRASIWLLSGIATCSVVNALARHLGWTESGCYWKSRLGIRESFGLPGAYQTRVDLAAAPQVKPKKGYMSELLVMVDISTGVHLSDENRFVQMNR